MSEWGTDLTMDGLLTYGSVTSWGRALRTRCFELDFVTVNEEEAYHVIRRLFEIRFSSLDDYSKIGLFFASPFWNHAFAGWSMVDFNRKSFLWKLK